MGNITKCADCRETFCEKRKPGMAMADCPIKRTPDTMERGLMKSLEPDMKEFAKQAALQQSEAYIRTEEGMFACNPRIDETIKFAKKMGYRKLGLAFCSGLRNESILVSKILEENGFEVISACCKVGGLSRELIGIENKNKSNDPENYQLMCNPMTQAEIMNSEGSEFNILIGLCVGHDSLFLKHANAMSTVLIAKDHVYGHNPIAALRLSGSNSKKHIRFRKDI